MDRDDAMDRNERTLMNEAGRERERVWSVELAGGEGERLRGFTEQWLGRHVPKPLFAMQDAVRP